MNKEIKTRWLAALRSGEYKQGRGFLKNANDEYCCLGVLCDLYRKEGELNWEEFIAINDSELYVNSYEVKNWAGIQDHNPFVQTENMEMVSLAELNDSYEFTFEKIADVIEKNL